MGRTVRIPASDVRNHHWINFRTGDQYEGRDLHYVTLSGMTLPHQQGKNDNWDETSMQINLDIRQPLNNIPIPLPPDDQRSYRPVFLIREWKAYTGLNAVYNQGPSTYNGHWVTNIKSMTPATATSNDKEYKIAEGGFLQTSDPPVVLHCKLRVRDRDAYLYRVAFQLDMLLCFAGYAEQI